METFLVKFKNLKFFKSYLNGGNVYSCDLCYGLDYKKFKKIYEEGKRFLLKEKSFIIPSLFISEIKILYLLTNYNKKYLALKFSFKERIYYDFNFVALDNNRKINFETSKI